MNIDLSECDEDLARVGERLIGATRAEEIFGSLRDPERMPRDVLRARYEELLGATNPSRFRSSPADADIARELQSLLGRHYEVAVARFDAAAYGAKPSPLPPRAASWVPFDATATRLALGGEIAEGTISTVYEGARASGDDQVGRLAIKVADDETGNDALWREKGTLEMLHALDGLQRAHLPTLVDHFRTEDGRVGLALRFLEHCHSFAAVRESPLHRSGVDPRHVAWMLRRMLSAAGYAHKNGVVHGAIEPEHVFVRAEDHHLFLIDWCWSSTNPARSGDRYRRHVPGFSAPETGREGAVPHPRADVYSIGKCCVFLLGGDVESGEMPDGLDDRLRSFVRRMAEPNPSRRPFDAWVLYHELDTVVRAIWGQKKFLEFEV